MKPTPLVEEVAEKAPVEMAVEPEWIGVTPLLGPVVRLLDDVWTRRPAAGSGPTRTCGWRWPEDWGAPMPARACAAWIRDEEAGASGVIEFE